MCQGQACEQDGQTYPTWKEWTGNRAQEQLYSRPETLVNSESLLGLGSHSFSLVYTTGQVGQSYPHPCDWRSENPRVCPGRFALEEVSGGLHSNALFTANCKARRSCQEHLRELNISSLPGNLCPWSKESFCLTHFTKLMVILVFVTLLNQKTEVYGSRSPWSWHSKGLEVTSTQNSPWIQENSKQAIYAEVLPSTAIYNLPYQAQTQASAS